MTAVWIYGLIALAWLSFTPLFYLLLRGIWHRHDPYPVAASLPSRFIVQIVTVGKSPEVVDGIIEALRGYALPMPCEIWVLGEEGDGHAYPADRILLTPRSYATPQKSERKQRALCYAREVRMREGIDVASTRILFLDDDSLPSEAYVVAAQRIDRPVAHGGITIRRPPDGNRIVHVCDHYRAADCVATCPRYCANGDVLVVHGEGMVTTGEVESAIGWDYGPGILAEDLIFGRRACLQFGYGYIPEQLYIISPKTFRDLFRQRRRWYWAVYLSFPFLDGRHKRFILARNAMGFIGFLATFFMFYVPITGITLPVILLIPTFTLLVGFFFFWGYGAWLNTHDRWETLLAVLLVWPACFVEGGILIGSLLAGKSGFYVAPKTLPRPIDTKPRGGPAAVAADEPVPVGASGTAVGATGEPFP